MPCSWIDIQICEPRSGVSLLEGGRGGDWISLPAIAMPDNHIIQMNVYVASCFPRKLKLANAPLIHFIHSCIHAFIQGLKKKKHATELMEVKKSTRFVQDICRWIILRTRGTSYGSRVFHSCCTQECTTRLTVRAGW